MAMQRIQMLALTLVLVLGLSADGRAQAGADVFEQVGVRDVQLFINATDLAELRATSAENTYYPADFEYLGTRVRNVGIRSRGLGSRNSTKLGLRVDFNRYASGQTFAGHKALVLDNLWQDASLVRERVAMAMFDRMGVPTPREVFVRVFVNGTYEGVYTIVEEMDSQLLTRIGNDGGVLFEYKYVGVYNAEDLGADTEPYVPLFEARTHEKAALDTLYGPLRDLFTAASSTSGVEWRNRVEALLDLRQLLTYVAIETFTSDNDGVIGEWGMNNFYLHRSSDGTQHQILPWDKDQAFGDVDAGIFLRADQNVLVRRALSFADLRAHYLDVLRQCAEAAAADGWLLAQINTAADLIDSAAAQDTRKQYDEATRADALAAMRTFAANRPARVIAQVQGVLSAP
jgi:spore coat protein CotH